MRIGIIVGSTRPGRVGSAVGHWVLEAAQQRQGATYELVEVADFELSLLNEPVVPGAANRNYESAATRAWGAKVDTFDAFVFVTPEYNHGVPAAFKNAVDVLYPEWWGKVIGFVGYGADGAVRCVEQWRGIVANFNVYDVRAQVALSLFTDFGPDGFAPLERRAGELDAVLAQVEEAAAKLSG